MTDDEARKLVNELIFSLATSKILEQLAIGIDPGYQEAKPKEFNEEEEAEKTLELIRRDIKNMSPETKAKKREEFEKIKSDLSSGKPCPDCGLYHFPYTDKPDTKKVEYVDKVLDLLSEPDTCSLCEGKGWLHMHSYWNARGGCGHIERCDRCKKYSSDLEALQVHEIECEACGVEGATNFGYCEFCSTVPLDDARANFSPGYFHNDEGLPEPCTFCNRFKVSDRAILKGYHERNCKECNEKPKSLAESSETDTSSMILSETEKVIETVEENTMEASKPQDKKVFKNVVVTESPDEQIHIPAGMSFSAARDWLSRRELEDSKVVDVHCVLPGYPIDAALATYKAIQRIFGFTALEKIPPKNIFDTEHPPVWVDVKVSRTDTVQVPWGRMAIPNMDNAWLETGIAIKDGMIRLQLTGQVKQKFRNKMDMIFQKAREILATESIYRGKAIKVDLSALTPRNFDPLKSPEFMDVQHVTEADLILPAKIQRAVQVNLFTPIKKTSILRKHSKVRRGILLAGYYGTGKTLTATVCAALCEKNGWTYIYIKDASQLPTALQVAQEYQPCVVFAEDIDRQVNKENDRDERTNNIMNSLDGVDNKNVEIITVLTTNNLEDIEKGMLRAGRLDAIIQYIPPDAAAAEALVRRYSGDSLDADADLKVVGERLAGQIPANIAEAVKRAKLAAIEHADYEDDQIKITVNDLLDGADQITAHSDLMREDDSEVMTEAEMVADVIGQHLSRAVRSLVNTDYDSIAEGENENVTHMGRNRLEKTVKVLNSGTVVETVSQK